MDSRNHDLPRLPETARNGTTLKLLSFNIQVGIASIRPIHYVTRSWRHLLPHEKHFNNLDEIATLIKDFDLVALQEVDAGSLRSSFVNQTKYLAERAGFSYWYHQLNRNIGHIARHSNGLLSHYDPVEVSDHKLPGRVRGRGAIVAKYGHNSNPLVVILMHLALGKKARKQQLEYVGEIVRLHKHVVVMGDFNCQPQSDEMRGLLDTTGLCAPLSDSNTFPSWRPNRKLDHILVSPSLEIKQFEVINMKLSDHLPISMEVVIPEAVKFVA